MGRYTVQLNDSFYGRVVLDTVNASSRSAAKTQARAAAVVSGDHSSGAQYTAGGVVDQSVVTLVSGTDPDGDLVVGPTSLPVSNEILDPFGRS